MSLDTYRENNCLVLYTLKEQVFIEKVSQWAYSTEVVEGGWCMRVSYEQAREHKYSGVGDSVKEMTGVRPYGDSTRPYNIYRKVGPLVISVIT